MTEAGYRSVVSGCLDNLPTLNSRLVRIFISSTFTDTREERNLLLEDVYPRLKSHCKEHYGMDFQLVDMRWGVPLETTDDHLASALCLQEIRNCQKLSTGPNFVTFLNQKHGYRPLQTSIPSSEFELLTSCLKDHGKSASLLETWYQKDTNDIPPIYVLQPISSIIPGYKDRTNKEASKQWDTIFHQLQEDLKFASNICCEKNLITEEEKHKYFMSVTEDEIFNGILKLHEDVADHCLCFVRIIEDITDHLDHSKAWRFIDMLSTDSKMIDSEAQLILSQLRDERITQKLENFNITRNFVKWSEKDGINRLDHKAYLEAFKESFYQSVVALIEKAVHKERSLVQDDLYIEVLQHATMAMERCLLFHGREDILHEIANYLKAQRGQPLVLYGQSGCGKTSIIAQTAKMSQNILKQKPMVILRFLGTSPDSSNLWRLLRSLCVQIAVCYGKDRQSVPEDFDELKDYFIDQLKLATAEKPMIILLDSLDQLSSENSAFKMNWLPRKLPENVRFIVSTYTEATDLIGTLKLIFISDSFIAVPVFSSELSIQVLKSWLQRENRTLTSEQFSLAEAAFEKCSLPLYVKLIYDQIIGWRSYTPVSEYSLAYTVQQSIDRLFLQLEKKHGTILVSRALAYVTASATGISETELEDLLSLDDVVLTSVYQIHIPPLRRIPPLLWVRIRHDISQYLVDKEVDEVRVFFWYHRQFFETAKKRYLQDAAFKSEIHSLMADYYLGKWYKVKKPFKYTPEQMKRVEASSPDGEADRRIAAQPVIFSQDAEGKNIRYNKRKFNKLPYHLHKSNRQAELRTTCLLNYDWLQNKLFATSIQQILLDYCLYGEQESVLHKAIKASLSTLKKFPETLAVEIAGRYLALLQTKCDSDEAKLLDDAMVACGKSLQLVPYQHCFSIPSEALMYTIEHPRVPVNPKMAAVSNDSAHYAILSNDNEVLIWDLATGEMETSTSLTTPNNENVNVMIKPSGKDILVCGVTNQQKDNPVFIVDINTGALENSLKLEKKYPKLGFSDDLKFEITQNTLLVMAINQAADVFDLKTGKLLHEFDLKARQMMLADDTLVLFHEKNATSFEIYDLTSYQVIHSIQCEEIPNLIRKSSDAHYGGLVYEKSPVVLVVSLDYKSNFGKTMCKIDLSRYTRDKLQDCQIVDDLCLITTMEGFVLWNIKSNKKKLELAIPDSVKPHYRVVDFEGILTKDKKTILSAYTGYFILWDAITGKLIHTFKATRSQITKTTLSPSGEYVTHASRRNNSILTWKFSAMMNRAREFEPLSMKDSARYLIANRSGTTAIVRSMTSNEFAVIDIEKGIIRCHVSEDHECMIPTLTQDGSYAVLREYQSDTALRIWDTHSGQLVKTIPISTLNLKGNFLGEKSENMAVLTESEMTGEHTLSFYNVPSGEPTGVTVQLSKFNMMQAFFAKNDDYILLSVEEQATPRVKVYAKAFRVKDGALVMEYDRMHPKRIQEITPGHDCFMGQHIHIDENGKESWEFVVIKIETGEIIASCRDPPSSVLCLGSVGHYGIDKDRTVYDIMKGVKCFQFDTDSDYHEILPSIRTAPKVTDDEKYAVWLHLSHNLLKVGDIESQTLLSVCPVHSMPMNIHVTPQRIILIGCEDGRIMMLQMVDNNTTSAFTAIFNRARKKVLQVKQSVLRTIHPQKTEEQGSIQTNARSSKACEIL